MSIQGQTTIMCSNIALRKSQENVLVCLTPPNESKDTQPEGTAPKRSAFKDAVQPPRHHRRLIKRSISAKELKEPQQLQIQTMFQKMKQQGLPDNILPPKKHKSRLGLALAVKPIISIKNTRITARLQSAPSMHRHSEKITQRQPRVSFGGLTVRNIFTSRSMSHFKENVAAQTKELVQTLKRKVLDQSRQQKHRNVQNFVTVPTQVPTHDHRHLIDSD